jgi:transcriptional activator HAC1
MATTPHIKFEHSPADSLADSFVSTPGTVYPPLFDTMNPAEAMTPQSFDDDSMFGGSIGGSVSGTPAPEKKPVKKRKSWGQQLPEPKTNLPPRYILDNKFTIADYSANPFSRKRAKTEDEKEQRRVERVLRNRRAAQSSRERKRQEVEALEAEKTAVERQNQDLQMRLADSEAKIAFLQHELEKLGGSSMKVFRGSSVASSPVTAEQFRQPQSPLTFSQPLFSSNESDKGQISTQPLVEPQPAVQTVNPASLSPEIRAVDDSTNASSSDMTQHPAAVLCDLQCQSEEQRPWMDSMIISRILAMTFFISLTSEVTSSILSPLSQIISSLRTGSPLSSTNSILTLIIWLATTTASLTTSTSMSSSSTTITLRPKFSLRISLLRRLLACSPNLARPLKDATMVAMRRLSSSASVRDCLSPVDGSRLGGTDSPSIEALMTLLWATHVIEKEIEQQAMAPKLDAATEVRQACMELDDMFKRRDLSGKRVVSFVSQSHGGKIADLGISLGADQKTRESQKSLDGWRTAFQ